MRAMPDTASVAVDRSDIRTTLEAVASGDLLPEEALARLDGATFIDIGDAKVDVGRDSRTGQPEIVYGPGKTPEQVAAIVETLVRSDVRPIIVSRAAAEQFHAVSAVAPTAIHHERSALIVLGPLEERPGRIAVVAAGTSGLPVAEDAAVV